MGLKEDHSYLYKRVRLKTILHIALGLVLILLPNSVPGQQAQQVGINGAVSHSLTYFGVLYLLCGLGLLIGLFRPGRTYIWLRTMLTVCAVYNTFWLAIIYIIAFQSHLNRSIAYVAVIYSYMTYNIWYVRNDPGWNAIQIVKEIRRNERAKSALK